MDTLELICHRARTEAKGYRRGTGASDVDEKLPFFSITKTPQGQNAKKYIVTGHNAQGHDNEPRMEFICDFLRHSVLPFISQECDVSGSYTIELHDSYSYLPNRDAYTNCLTFSRRRDDVHMTLFPNPYQIGNYGNGQFNDLNADKVPWEQKLDTMFFAGSTTGSRDPLSNARIAACLWSLQHPQVSKFRITNVVQMSEELFRARVPRAQEILCEPVPLQENFKYKYLVNIAGNTCAWSRVPLIMSSKSLMLQMYHADIEWFYPMLIEGTHFMGCAEHTLLSKRNFAISNPQLVQFIIANANRFSSTFLGRNQAALYAVSLLEAIAENNKA